MNNNSVLLRINLFFEKDEVKVHIYINSLEFDECPLFGDECISSPFAW
jgi:hypothetical protein